MMKLVPQSAPYIRKPVSVARMMTDVIIALLPVTVFAMVQNGWGSIYVLLISLVTMVGSELVANLFIKWPTGMKFKEMFSNINSRWIFTAVFVSISTHKVCQ